MRICHKNFCNCQSTVHSMMEAKLVDIKLSVNVYLMEIVM